jgi:hypothetical protein
MRSTLDRRLSSGGAGVESSRAKGEDEHTVTSILQGVDTTMILG